MGSGSRPPRSTHTAWTRCRVEYLAEYVFSDHPWPVALGLPVGLGPEPQIEGLTGLEPDRRPPAFLYDLVPQGKGRKYLLEQLQLQDSDNLIMPLVMAGAFNPIRLPALRERPCILRTKRREESRSRHGAGVRSRSGLESEPGFLDHLSLHAMLASGTTGVQGVAPKFLLSTDREGRWFADMALPDDRAQEHWLIKLPRGKSDEDRAVLRNEAGFLRLAAACGMRTMAEPKLHGEILFVRRFDRQVIDGKVHRLHQESLASICELARVWNPQEPANVAQGASSGGV